MKKILILILAPLALLVIAAAPSFTPRVNVLVTTNGNILFPLTFALSNFTAHGGTITNGLTNHGQSTLSNASAHRLIVTNGAAFGTNDFGTNSIYATGNIRGLKIIGDGSLLTGLTAVGDGGIVTNGGTGTGNTLSNLTTVGLTGTSATFTNRFLSGQSNITTSLSAGTNLIVLDAAAGNIFSLQLSNVAKFTNILNLAAGQTFLIHIQQGTNLAVYWDTNYWNFPSNTPPTITTNANRYDLISCVSGPQGTNVHAVWTGFFR